MASRCLVATAFKPCYHFSARYLEAYDMPVCVIPAPFHYKSLKFISVHNIGADCIVDKHDPRETVRSANGEEVGNNFVETVSELYACQRSPTTLYRHGKRRNVGNFPKVPVAVFYSRKSERVFKSDFCKIAAIHPVRTPVDGIRRAFVRCVKREGKRVFRGEFFHS